MDTYIQALSSLFDEWQLIAVNNINYTVVIALAGFLIGVQLVNSLKKNTVLTLSQQLTEEKQALKQISENHEELIGAQKNDAKTITDLQQQQENSVNELKKNNTIHAELKKKYDLQFQTLQEQEAELDKIKSTVDGKTDEIKQLQAEVDQQKTLITQQTTDLKNSVDAAELSTEFDLVKQQLQLLQSELDDKNKQIVQFENNNSTSEDNNSLAEDINQQHTEQLADFNNRLKSLLSQAIVQNGDQSGAGNGLFDKVLNIFSSIDNSLGAETKKVKPNKIEEDEDVWLQHQKIIDQVINQFSIQANENDHQIINNDDQINTEIVESEDNKIVNDEITEDEVIDETKNDQVSSVISKNIPPEIAEKFKGMTEKTDQFQEKLKGLYQKISS